MTKNIFAASWIIFLTSLFMLSSCQPIQSVVFSDQCTAPCWRNIKLGETHFQDAIDMIKKFQDIDAKEINVSGSWNIFSDFIDFDLTNGENIRAYAIDNIIVLITFYNPKGITFEECIKEFGEPEYVTQFSKLGVGSPFIPASDAPHVWFSAISLKKGVVFGYDTQDFFDLNASTTISEISYFDVKLFKELYQSNFLVRFDPLEEIPQDKLHIWKGYGDIRDLYP